MFTDCCFKHLSLHVLPHSGVFTAVCCGTQPADASVLSADHLPSCLCCARGRFFTAQQAALLQDRDMVEAVRLRCLTVEKAARLLAEGAGGSEDPFFGIR